MQGRVKASAQGGVHGKLRLGEEGLQSDRVGKNADVGYQAAELDLVRRTGAQAVKIHGAEASLFDQGNSAARSI